MTYIECERHNVCRDCGKPRSNFNGSVMGGKHGWQCHGCYEKEKEETRRSALDAFDEENYNEFNYWREDEAKCPYCDTDSEFEYCGEDSPEPITCDVCGNTFRIELDFEIKYTTKRIKPKQS